jgi:serine/threonine-protein kinase
MSGWLMYSIVGAVAALGIALIVSWARRPYRLRLPAIEIFAGNHQPGPAGYITIETFPANAAGDIAPTSEIYTNQVTALVRDGAGNIYVASDTGNRIQVYAPGAAGAAPPLRNIEGLATKLFKPAGLALDRQGNLYVAESGSPSTGHEAAVLKFAAGADGNVPPIDVIPSQIPIAGQAAAMNTRLGLPLGVAVDYDGSIYVVCRIPVRLLRYGPGASGDVVPIAEITMGLSDPQHVTLDGDGYIYVTNGDPNPSIAVYAPSPVTDVPPVRVITSSELSRPYGIAVDGAGNVFVGDIDRQSILVFDSGASGNVAPFRKIEGPNTGLAEPCGIAIRVLGDFRQPATNPTPA